MYLCCIVYEMKCIYTVNTKCKSITQLDNWALNCKILQILSQIVRCTNSEGRLGYDINLMWDSKL